jgi:MATE family multidrug resistance protein
MIISVSLHYLMVTGLFFVVKVLHMSARVGWLVVVFVFMLFSMVFYLRYRGGKWKDIKMVEANSTDV